MRTIVPLLLAAGALLVVPGMAAADSSTYVVSRSWKLSYDNGDPTIDPHMDDDYVEVTCHNEDQMRNWRVNDKKLVADSREKADGTGIQIEPEWTGDTETLKITIRCEKTTSSDSGS